MFPLAPGFVRLGILLSSLYSAWKMAQAAKAAGAAAKALPMDLLKKYWWIALILMAGSPQGSKVRKRGRTARRSGLRRLKSVRARRRRPAKKARRVKPSKALRAKRGR